MKYTSPVKFNHSVLSDPKTKRLGTKLFWSLFCPTLMIVIACILSNANGVGLFIIGDAFDNFSNIMIMGRTAVMTLIAALALNTNLNSGRMDFSLGATGILACLFASLCSAPVRGLSSGRCRLKSAFIFRIASWKSRLNKPITKSMLDPPRLHT